MRGHGSTSQKGALSRGAVKLDPGAQHLGVHMCIHVCVYAHTHTYTHHIHMSCPRKKRVRLSSIWCPFAARFLGAELPHIPERDATPQVPSKGFMIQVQCWDLQPYMACALNSMVHLVLAVASGAYVQGIFQFYFSSEVLPKLHETCSMHRETKSSRRISFRLVGPESISRETGAPNMKPRRSKDARDPLLFWVLERRRWQFPLPWHAAAAAAGSCYEKEGHHCLCRQLENQKGLCSKTTPKPPFKQHK